MPTFSFKKLVRDNIYAWHQEGGHIVKGKKLSGKSLRQALCAKLQEELSEVNAALNKQELTEEIGDVLQVLEDLCAEEGITMDEVMREKLKKFNNKGGFRAGAYIDSVHMPDENDKWVKYCRASPAKYPELKS